MQTGTYLSPCPPFAGTMSYVPPEAMRRGSGVKVTSFLHKKWDVYSFAVLMCYTLSGKDPFAGMTTVQIISMVLLDRNRPSIPPHVDEDPEHPVFKQMIQQLWHHDPHERGDFVSIVNQLHKHVADPKLKRAVEQTSTSRKFLRMLPPLLAGAQNKSTNECVGLGFYVAYFSCNALVISIPTNQVGIIALSTSMRARLRNGEGR